VNIQIGLDWIGSRKMNPCPNSGITRTVAVCVRALFCLHVFMFLRLKRGLSAGGAELVYMSR